MLIIKSSNGPFPLTFLYIIHVIPAAKVNMQKTYDHTIFWSFFLLYTFIQNINHVIFLHSNYELPANSNNCKHANTHARQRRDLAGFFETNHNFVQNYYDLWGYKCYERISEMINNRLQLLGFCREILLNCNAANTCSKCFRS